VDECKPQVRLGSFHPAPHHSLTPSFVFSFARWLVWNDEMLFLGVLNYKDPEAAAALVSAHGEAPGALGPLVITQSMRSFFRLTTQRHATQVRSTQGQPDLISRLGHPAPSISGDFGRVRSVFGSFGPYDAVYFGSVVARE
jgi:hypothetical protein